MEDRTEMDIFRQQNYIEAFDRFRQPCNKAMNEYLVAFKKLMNIDAGPISGLDLGCGTGHFALHLAAALQDCHGYLDALDRSEGMLHLLRRKCRIGNILNINLIHTDFFDFIPTSKYAFVWASDILHLMRDLNDFMAKTATVLGEQGRLFIRMSSHAQLLEYEWGRFFPAALARDLERHHDVPDVLSCLAHHGFSDIKVQEINESRWLPASHYLAFFEAKYLSSLHLIEEEVFQDSFRRMKETFASHKRVLRKARTTFITARLGKSSAAN